MNKNIFLPLILGSCVITTVSAANITPAAAEKRLNTAAVDKVNKARINLKSLVQNDSNDLIVEYNIDTGPSTTSAEKRSAIASDKQTIRRNHLQSKGITILRDYNSLPITTYRINDREALVELLNDPNIKAVYPNRINKAFATDNLNLINQPQTAAKKFTGEGTSVVIADTGVDYRHSDFGNCTAVNTPASTCRVIQAFDTATDDHQLDDNGHGTNVAGIVAQVAPKTKIIGIDVFSSSGGAYDSDILAAINWTSNNAKTYNIKAINLSLGVSDEYSDECTQSSYSTAFQNLRNNNVVPVVASGNDQFTNGVAYPACSKGAVRVGAVYASNYSGLTWGSFNQCTDRAPAPDQVTCFSNSGKLLTLLAPGALITAGGVTQGGTSQAAPHVAGAIAILRANNVVPAETIDQTIQRLQTTGKPIRDPRNGIVTSRIDLLAATNSLNIK